jgi:hypothetical protein
MATIKTKSRNPKFETSSKLEIEMSKTKPATATGSAHEITSPFPVAPLTPTLSPEYRGEGVIS